MKFWQSLAVAALLGSATETSASLTDLLCGVEVSIEYIYWKPFNVEIPWAQGFALDVDNKRLTKTLYLQPDYRSGIGLEARYRFPGSCWTALARFHWVRPAADAQLSVEPPVSSWAIYESGSNQIPVGWRADSRVSTPYYSAEALIIYSFLPTNCLELSLVAGAAFFSVQRNYSDLVVPPSRSPLLTPFTSPAGRGRLYNKFSGAGPVVGLAASTASWCGLRGYGECLLTGAVGRKKNFEYFSSIIRFFDPAVIIQGEWSPITSLVPGILCRLGGSWEMNCWHARWAVNMGWEHRAYIGVTLIPNVVNENNSLVLAGHPAPFVNNLALGGPFLGASVSF